VGDEDVGNKPIVTLGGWLDYSTADFSYLIGCLEELHSDCKNAISRIEKQKEEVKKNRESLDEPDEILEALDYWGDLIPSWRDDLARLVRELPIEVHSRHIKTLESISKRGLFEYRTEARAFKELHIEKDLKDETLRPLVDEIYAKISDLTLSVGKYSGNVKNRLEAFEGKKGLGRGKKEKILDPLIVPEGTVWRDVNIRFTTWQSIRIKVGSIEASRTYPELGLEDIKKGGACPTLPWLVFARIAKNEGEITFRELPKPGHIKGKVLKSHIMKLNKIFCDLFPNIQGKRPITYYRKEGKYRAWFGKISMNKSCDPESEGDILLEIEDKFNTTPPAMGGDDIRAVKIRR